MTDNKDGYDTAAGLRDLAQRGKIKLLRASALADMARRGELQSTNSNALAPPDLVEKCLNEATAAASVPRFVYPGIVAVSYHWPPDSGTGPLCWRLSTFLHWYAAQRAKYTQNRLYTVDPHADTDSCIRNADFHWDFVVCMDLRVPDAMDVVFGNRGVVVCLLTNLSQDDIAPISSRDYADEYFTQRRTFTEHYLGALCKVPGSCLDFGRWKQLFQPAKDTKDENDPDNTSAVRAFSGDFAGAKDSDLAELAMEDNGGLNVAGSCLEVLSRGAELLPVSPSFFASVLPQIGGDEDSQALAGAYQRLATVVLKGQDEIRLKGLALDGLTASAQGGHGSWSMPGQWRGFGEAMELCRNLKRLILLDCELGDDGLVQFADASAERPGCAPLLEEINLSGCSGVGERGMVALARALNKGAMPGLREVHGVGTEGMADGAGDRVAKAAGMPVTHDGWYLWTFDREAQAEGVCACCVVA